MRGVILPLLQDLAFPCAEFPEIAVGPFLLPVGVPLSGHTAIWCISLSISSVPEMAFLLMVVSASIAQAQELFRWWIVLKVQSCSRLFVVLQFRYFRLFRGLGLGPSYVPVD